MNRYLIDTNIISEIRKGDRANRGVREWFEQNADSDMWLSVLVVGELQRSVELIGLRDPGMSQVQYALGEGIEFEHDRLDGYRAAFNSLCTWGVGQGYLNEDQRKEVLRMLADFPIED